MAVVTESLDRAELKDSSEEPESKAKVRISSECCHCTYIRAWGYDDQVLVANNGKGTKYNLICPKYDGI